MNSDYLAWNKYSMKADDLQTIYPEIQNLQAKKPFLWINPALAPVDYVLPKLPLGLADIEDAEARLQRFAPLLAVLFPELQATKGIIESEFRQIPRMANYLREKQGVPLEGSLWLKADHALPVAGSVKARGGVYEVLCFAEKLALENGFLSSQEDNYLKLADPEVRDFFGQYTVSVGSTGNLGLSIGIMAVALGFKACVHMSAEAKQWKKKRLRDLGVDVIEHEADYSKAVRVGRELAKNDPLVYFVDDENSKELFLGYSVAALRLKEQLLEANISVDAEHPLFVYLPCGVGGAPGGITFGLKHVFGDSVHCFFAEPTESPCMFLGMLTQFKDDISIYDIGLHNKTEADGLAVSKASRLVGELVKNLVSGCFTVDDEALFRFLYQLDVTEKIRVEPSATAGFAGPGCLLNSPTGQAYLIQHDLKNRMKQANHIVWTTGGLFVPLAEYEKFRVRGAELERRHS